MVMFVQLFYLLLLCLD